MEITKIIPETDTLYSIDIISIILDEKTAQVKVTTENKFFFVDTQLTPILDEGTDQQKNIIKIFFKQVIAAATENLSSDIENDII